jgi:hypothetical protein
MSAPFAKYNHALTAVGKLKKNCLFSKSETDLADLAQGNITPLIEETILAESKALGGQFNVFF